MSLPDEFSPLAEPLESTCELIRRASQPGMIIGAVAVGLVARPRQTNDVDATVWCPDESLIRELLDLAQDLGLEPRRADTEGFARKARVLQLQHTRTRIGVDVSLAELPFEQQAIAKRQEAKAGELTIPHSTAEDLIVMKMIAHREQDLLDVQNVVRTARRLDRRRVLRWVREFAKLLDSPELVDEIEAIWKRHRPSRR